MRLPSSLPFAAKGCRRRGEQRERSARMAERSRVPCRECSKPQGKSQKAKVRLGCDICFLKTRTFCTSDLSSHCRLFKKLRYVGCFPEAYVSPLARIEPASVRLPARHGYSLPCLSRSLNPVTRTQMMAITAPTTVTRTRAATI